MDKARADLAIYRLETVRQCIISAKALIEISDYKGAQVGLTMGFSIVCLLQKLSANISPDFIIRVPWDVL